MKEPGYLMDDGVEGFAESMRSGEKPAEFLVEEQLMFQPFDSMLDLFAAGHAPYYATRAANRVRTALPWESAPRLALNRPWSESPG